MSDRAVLAVVGVLAALAAVCIVYWVLLFMGWAVMFFSAFG
jgi:hypothetical protein